MTKEHHYDLIFMDISMPVMDGYEATRLIRNEENLNNESTIVALTASAILSRREQSLGVGMTDYISKPFAPTQLLEVIRKYTNRQEEAVVSILTNKQEEVPGATVEMEETLINKILDVSYLQKFYGGDHDHAADMFEIFLLHTVKEVPQLRLLIEEEDWEATRRLAHRIKPNFSMVGLTQLEKKILVIEKMADQKEDANTLINLMNEVESKLVEAKPFLIAQLEKYKSLSK
jgi:response regulator RpfG family c-di-GMP phosphodiesterase